MQSVFPRHQSRDLSFLRVLLVDQHKLSAKVVAALLLGLASLAPAWGQSRLGFDVGLNEQYSNNINLTPTDTESDLISTPRFGLNYSRQSAKTDANIAFQIRREIYRNETQDDRTFPSLNARVNWQIVRERFTWALEDFASQNEINVADAPTADNTQNVNTIITGPDIFARLGESNTMQFGARVSDSNYQFTDQESTRTSAFIRWLYDVSFQTTLSLNYDFSSTNFADPANSDFERQDLFFQIRTRRPRSSLIFDIGGTRTEPEEAPEEDSPLFRVSWDRQLTGKSSIGLTASVVENDSSLNLAIVGTAPPNLAPGGSVANTGNVFTDRRLNFFYTNRGRRTTATVRVFARDQVYQDTPDDQSSAGLAFDIRRNLRPRLTASFVADYVETRFLDEIPRRTDQDTSLRLNFSYRLGRWLSLNAGLTWRDRDSTDSTQDYTETRAILGITYARTSL